KRLPVHVTNLVAPKNESYFVDAVVSSQKISCFVHGDVCGLRNRITVCPAANCRESSRLDSVFFRELQRIPIAIRQHLGLTVLAASPDRTHCVNDKPRT